MEIIFLFYENITAPDAIAPHEILCRLPCGNIKRVAKQSGYIKTDSGLVLEAEHSIADISHADILLVPGAGNATTILQYPEILDWLAKIHATTTWITSVCTGSRMVASFESLVNTINLKK